MLCLLLKNGLIWICPWQDIFSQLQAVEKQHVATLSGCQWQRIVATLNIFLRIFIPFALSWYIVCHKVLQKSCHNRPLKIASGDPQVWVPSPELASSAGIAFRLPGRIWLQSNPGAGVTTGQFLPENFLVLRKYFFPKKENKMVVIIFR